MKSQSRPLTPTYAAEGLQQIPRGSTCQTTARHTANLLFKKKALLAKAYSGFRGAPPASTAARHTANLFLTRWVDFCRPLTYLKRSF